MTRCRAAVGVVTATPFLARLGEPTRPALPEAAELQPAASELLRQLHEALAQGLGIEAEAAAEDVERLLRVARKQLEQHLDEVSPCGAQSWEEVSSCSANVELSREAALQLLSADVPSRLLACLGTLNFEAQKDATRLFEALSRLGTSLGLDVQIVEYVKGHPHILEVLLEGSGRPEVAWQCGQMLRNCARSPQLVHALLETGAVERLLGLARHKHFEISSEAFSSLAELLLEQKEVAAEYVEGQFDTFFDALHQHVKNGDYVQQRQALQLLGKILLSREFREVMITYVQNEQFLQIHMNLLRDSSVMIQADAFHVFKAFVGNPHKPRRVQQILFQNKEKLVQHLTTFYERSDDAFATDLDAVIELIQELEAPTRPPRRQMTWA